VILNSSENPIFIGLPKSGKLLMDLTLGETLRLLVWGISRLDGKVWA